MKICLALEESIFQVEWLTATLIDHMVFVLDQWVFVLDHRGFVRDQRVFVLDHRVFVLDQWVFILDHRGFVLDQWVLILRSSFLGSRFRHILPHARLNSLVCSYVVS